MTQQAHTEVDQASETLHHVIDSGRQMFRAGERVVDEIERLWHSTRQGSSMGGMNVGGGRQRRLWIVGVMAGVCLAIAVRMRSH